MLAESLTITTTCERHENTMIFELFLNKNAHTASHTRQTGVNVQAPADLKFLLTRHNINAASLKCQQQFKSASHSFGSKRFQREFSKTNTDTRSCHPSPAKAVNTHGKRREVGSSRTRRGRPLGEPTLRGGGVPETSLAFLVRFCGCC